MRTSKSFHPSQQDQTRLLPPSPPEWQAHYHQVYLLLDLEEGQPLRHVQMVQRRYVPTIEQALLHIRPHHGNSQAAERAVELCVRRLLDSGFSADDHLLGAPSQMLLAFPGAALAYPPVTCNRWTFSMERGEASATKALARECSSDDARPAGCPRIHSDQAIDHITNDVGHWRWAVPPDHAVASGSLHPPIKAGSTTFHWFRRLSRQANPDGGSIKPGSHKAKAEALRRGRWGPK